MPYFTKRLAIMVALVALSAVLAAPALAAGGLYSGSAQSEYLMPCSGSCKQYQCGTGESISSIEGCPAVGYYCCITAKPAQTTPSCMGFCIDAGKCESVYGNGSGCDGGNNLVCCGVEKKNTVTPEGEACTCMAQDKCAGGNVNSNVPCTTKGEVCCLPATASGAAAPTSKSTANMTCGSYNFPCPLGDDIMVIPGNVIRWVLGLVGALFLAMFVWGGALYVTAGDSKRAEDGKKTLVNAVVGIAIVSLSYILLSKVLGLVGDALK